MLRPPVIVIPPGSSGSAFYNNLNNNFALLADAIERSLDRFGSLPNQMESHLDMNSFRIINCADPIDPSDVVTLRHLRNEIASYIAGTRVEWTGPWAPGVSYEPWDLVYHNGTVYINILAHNATFADEPGVGPNWSTYWDVFLGFSSWLASVINTTNCVRGPLNPSTGNVQGDLCSLSAAIDDIITGSTVLQSTNISTNNCPSGPLTASTGNVQGDLCVLSNSIDSLTATDVTVNACPTGPVNANTNVQNAICQLSSAITPGVTDMAVFERTTNVTAPANSPLLLNATFHDGLNPDVVRTGTGEMQFRPGRYYLVVHGGTTNGGLVYCVLTSGATSFAVSTPHVDDGDAIWLSSSFAFNVGATVSLTLRCNASIATGLNNRLRVAVYRLQ